ncbi:MAG: hydrogenase maturation nickel metallochaperone HypA [Eubacterium sp.]
MHELGIIHQIIKTVDEVKKEQSLKDVEAIVLQIGEMSDVIPEYLTQAWLSVKDNCGYNGTRLEIERIKARARCLNCGCVCNIRDMGASCPQCSGEGFKIISGKEFLIKEIRAK